MFVSETIIDALVESLENADFEDEVALLGEQQPALFTYIYSEDFELFTDNEKDLLLYIVLVLYRSVEKVRGEIPPLSKKALEDAEEVNWERLDKVTSKKFRDRMDIFFEAYDQEDLLAFVEDNLVEDDDDKQITKEGREPLFVALKSIIDVIK